MGVEVVVRAAPRAWLSAALIGLVALLGASTPGYAAVTLTASRAEALYSADSNPDCSALNKLPDDQLPLNVIRLHAVVDGAVPGTTRYRWAVPPNQPGMLVADLDLGPADETAAIRALCADFGNGCILTADKLPFYNQPTVLWVAPTCETLSTKTSRRIAGGTVRVAVTVTQARRRLGKATTKPPLGYGRAATVTLLANGKDGIGVPAVPVDIDPLFGAVVTATGITLPGPGLFEFNNGNGGFVAVASCDSTQYAACTGSMLYQQAGVFVAALKDRFDDGSALCDNLAVKVLSANIIPKLTVTATPKGTFIPGDPVRGTVHLTVTLHNASPKDGGSGILLVGSTVLQCDSALHLAGTKDSRQTLFDLQHCSSTAIQQCSSDAECQPFACGDCTAGEFCLLHAHCSQTLVQACQGSADCRKPTCADCQDDEVCVQVLNTPAILVPVGGEVNLIDKDVAVRNDFPDVAHLLDTWTVHSFNAGAVDAKLRYLIRPGPTGP